MTPRGGGAHWDSQLFGQQLSALGERVRAARQSHAWSQQDLGNRAEIDRANLSRVEGGKKNVTLEVLWRLASTLQLHWADLLDDRTTDIPEAPHASAPFEQQLTTFGTRVYQARVLQRSSQQALAGRAGIGPSTIYWIEAGTRNVTLETLSRLAAGLRVHWADRAGATILAMRQAADEMAAQSQQMADSAKELLASAQSGGFGFHPEAADTMIAALQDSIADLHVLSRHLDVISQAPKLGRTPAALVVSPFTQQVATDEQGIVRAIGNLRQILTDMISAYQEAKKNYAESDTLAMQAMRKLHH